MKTLKVYYINGETDIWQIPFDETVEDSIKGIQEELGLEIVDYEKVSGY